MFVLRYYGTYTEKEASKPLRRKFMDFIPFELSGHNTFSKYHLSWFILKPRIPNVIGCADLEITVLPPPICKRLRTLKQAVIRKDSELLRLRYGPIARKVTWNTGLVESLPVLSVTKLHPACMHIQNPRAWCIVERKGGGSAAAHTDHNLPTYLSPHTGTPVAGIYSSKNRTRWQYGMKMLRE